MNTEMKGSTHHLYVHNTSIHNKLTNITSTHRPKYLKRTTEAEDKCEGDTTEAERNDEG